MKFPPVSLAWLQTILTGFFVRITGDTMTGDLQVRARAYCNSNNLNGGSPISVLGITSDLQTFGSGLGNASACISSFRNDANGPVVYVFKSRSTTPPTLGAINTGDTLGLFSFIGDDGITVGGVTGLRFLGIASGAWNVAATRNADFVVQTANAGVNTEKFRVTYDGNLQLFSNIFLDANRIFRNRIYTVGTLPAGVNGMRTFVSDALAPAWGAAVIGGGAVVTPVYYNGAWSVG